MKHSSILNKKSVYMTRSLYYTLFLILQTFKNRDITLEIYTLRHNFRDITFWGIDKC